MGERFIFLIFLLLLAVCYCTVIAKPSKLRIVNGTNAEENEFPYMVQIIDQFSKQLCGGAIIGPEWILTAGTCVAVEVDSIVYGTNKLYVDGDGFPYKKISVKKTHQHPKYAFSIYGFPFYDVGILQLEEPIPYGKNAQPIHLADENEAIPFHVPGVLSGWGGNETWVLTMPYLQKIELELLSDTECEEKIDALYHSRAFSAIHNLCSNDYWSGQCMGDGGSPIVINGTHYGMVSWQYKPCGIVPGTYSRITNPEYRAFIKNITNI